MSAISTRAYIIDMPKHEALQNLKTTYDRAIGLFAETHKKTQIHIGHEKSHVLMMDFQEKISFILAHLSGRAIEFMDEKYPENTLSQSEKAEKAHKYAVRVNELLFHGENIAPKSIPELLDQAIDIQADILAAGTIHLPRIFTTPTKESGIFPGNRNGIDELKTASKYNTLIHVLSKNNIDINTLATGIEALDDTWMRQIPYRVVWLPNPERTICISDEIGEKTYVYHGYVDIVSLKLAKKGGTIDDIPCVGVEWDEWMYANNLQDAVFWSMPESYGNVIWSFARKMPQASSRATLSQIFAWQVQLLMDVEGLQRANIIETWWVYYFWSAKGQVSWKQWMSFPNTLFNRSHGIGAETWKILNLQQLKKMFAVLGIRVATDEEEKILKKNMENEVLMSAWKEEITANTEWLKQANIIEEAGIYYFWDAKGSSNWRQWMSFPNALFNREHEIGTKEWVIQNPHELKKMFAILGVRVATDAEEVQRWTRIIATNTEWLKQANIIEEVGIYYFWDAKGNSNWRQWLCFPNTTFNKEHRIGSKEWVIRSLQELKKMFAVLGIRVATEGEELARKKRN